MPTKHNARPASRSTWRRRPRGQNEVVPWRSPTAVPGCPPDKSRRSSDKFSYGVGRGAAAAGLGPHDLPRHRRGPRRPHRAAQPPARWRARCSASRCRPGEPPPRPPETAGGLKGAAGSLRRSSSRTSRRSGASLRRGGWPARAFRVHEAATGRPTGSWRSRADSPNNRHPRPRATRHGRARRDPEGGAEWSAVPIIVPLRARGQEADKVRRARRGRRRTICPSPSVSAS